MAEAMKRPWPGRRGWGLKAYISGVRFASNPKHRERLVNTAKGATCQKANALGGKLAFSRLHVVAVQNACS